MKKKKSGILIAAVSIIVCAVLVAMLSPFIKSGVDSLTAKKYIAEDLKNVDSITLIAHSSEVDGNRNSVAGVKEAVRLGADAVVVDLCFRANGTPVMTDNYESNTSAPTVETLFTAMNEKKYEDVKIYFNIVQLSTLSEFNRLAVEYNMTGRIYLFGIDKSRYGLISSDDTIAPFLLKYKITEDDKKLIKTDTFSVPECIAQYGASGLELDASDASLEVIKAFDDFGVPFIVSNVSSVKDLCTALLNGANSIYVEDIEKSADILDGWIKAMQERNRSEIEQSLKSR